jgi:myosin-5
VSYKTQNFLDKNRDFVVAEHQALMQASSQPFTHLLFPADPDAVRGLPPGLCSATATYRMLVAPCDCQRALFT